MEPLLTPDELAALLKVKKRYIYELTSTGRIPYIKVGRFLRFRRSEIEEWLKNNTHIPLLSIHERR